MHLTRTTARRTPTRSESLLLLTLFVATVASVVPIGPAVQSQPSEVYSDLSSRCAEPCTLILGMTDIPDARMAAIWRP